MDNILTPAPPLPRPTILTKPFWEGCLEDSLRLQKCSKCGRLRFYPAESCPYCGTLGGTWVDATGRGRVYSWIVVHKNPDLYWRTQIPYVSAIIELEDQARLYMPGLITGAAPSAIHADLPVQVWFDEVAPGHKLPRWRVAAGEE